MDETKKGARPVLLDSVLRAHARQRAAKTMCEYEGVSYSYADLDAAATAIARQLADIGIRPGASVAAYMPSGPALLACMFGVQRAGAVYVPCSTFLAPDEVRYQVEQAEAAAILVDSALLPKLAAITGALPSIRVTWESDDLLRHIRSGQRQGVVPPVAVRLSPSSAAMIMYTSGTTDRPKGIVITHGNLIAIAGRLSTALGWTPEDRFLHFFPMYHMNGGITSIVPAVLTGAALVFVSHFSVSRFAHDLVEHDITFCNVNATHAKMILNTPTSRWDRKHRARRMYLGLTLEKDLITSFERRFRTKFCCGYGLTEALGLAAITGPSDLRRQGSAGRPAPGLANQ